MILIISAVFPPEPVVSANLSFDIANELANRDKIVTVISPKPSRPFGHVFEKIINTNEKFNHFELNSFISPKSKIFGRFFESYSFGKASKKFISENLSTIDVIYMNTWPLFAQYFVIKEAKKNNIPVILHIQDIYPESIIKKLPTFVGFIGNIVLSPIDRYIFKNSTKIIAISSSMKRYLVSSRKIEESKVAVVRNWQDDAKFISFKPEIKQKDRRFTFMYVGSISPSAGVDLIIKGYHKIKDKANTRLVIAGSGSDKEKCRKLANEGNIEFWDAPQKEIPEIQNQADVLLLSLKKGVGLTASPSKFTAYLLSKKPIIASLDDNSDTAQSIHESNCGYVVKPEDENMLAKAMNEIALLQPKKLIDMGNSGFEYAIKNLSKRENLNKILNLIS